MKEYDFSFSPQPTPKTMRFVRLSLAERTSIVLGVATTMPNQGSNRSNPLGRIKRAIYRVGRVVVNNSWELNV